MRCHECTGKFGLIRHRLFTFSGSVYFCRKRCLENHQARVLEAMGRLGSGAPVTQVALDLGYDSVSAFSAMFRRAAGTSPSAYRQRA